MIGPTWMHMASKHLVRERIRPAWMWRRLQQLAHWVLDSWLFSISRSSAHPSRLHEASLGDFRIFLVFVFSRGFVRRLLCALAQSRFLGPPWPTCSWLVPHWFGFGLAEDPSIFVLGLVVSTFLSRGMGGSDKAPKAPLVCREVSDTTEHGVGSRQERGSGESNRTWNWKERIGRIANRMVRRSVRHVAGRSGRYPSETSVVPRTVQVSGACRKIAPTIADDGNGDLECVETRCKVK